jgi:hypothetical protein
MGNNKIRPEQIQFIPLDDLIHEVITLKEACRILDVAESTLRTRVLKGEFEPWEYRKADTIILFTKKAIEARADNFRIRQKSK